MSGSEPAVMDSTEDFPLSCIHQRQTSSSQKDLIYYEGLRNTANTIELFELVNYFPTAHSSLLFNLYEVRSLDSRINSLL